MKLWASSISEEEEQPSSSSISLLQQRQQQPSTPATTSSRHHNVFFGLPIVGFFRSVHSTEDERTPIITRSSRLSSERQHFDIEHQQRPVIHQRQQQYQQQSSATTKLQGKRRHRTGKELWAILRYHVYHETFHIDDWRTDEEKKTVVKNFDEMVLPYDFSVRDCLLSLVVYLGISVVAFSFVFERWPVIDSMYFACVSFTTIGYGDLSPSGPGGRLFCIFFALGGVAVLAIALGVLGSKIIEAEVTAMEATKQELVKDWFNMLKMGQRGDTKLGQSMSGRNNPRVLHHSGSTGSDSFAYLSDFDDPNIHDDQEQSWWQQVKGCCVLFTDLLCRYGPSLTPLFLGSLLIGRNEGWTFIDSIYYCVVTTTTIGYGDMVPQSESMKLFAVFFIPLSVGAMGHFLGTVANFIVEQRRKAYDKQLWKHELTLHDLQSMSSSADGVVSELDFVVFMLQAMKKVDKELIDRIREHFHVLDLTHSNTLCRQDLELMAKQKLRTVVQSRN